MSCPAVKKDLFPCEAHLDGLSGFHGHEAGSHLHGIGRGLGTESAAHVRFHHTDLPDRETQNHSNRPLDVVRGLGGAPKGQVSVRVIFGYARLRFDECCILPFVSEGIGPDHIALSQSRFHISELLVDLGAHVARILVVHKRRPFCDGLFQAQDRGQFLIVHLDEGQGFHGRLQVDGGHCSHLVPDVPDLVMAEEEFVISGGADAVLDQSCILGCYNGFDAWYSLRAGRVDVENSGVGQGAVQYRAIEHSRKSNVVGIHGSSRGLVGRIDSRRPRIHYRIFIHRDLSFVIVRRFC